MIFIETKEKSKMSSRGGRRPGAGRKSKATKLLEAGFVCTYFGPLEQENFWKSMLDSKDERVRLDAGKYLTNRLYGRAAQAVQMNVNAELSLSKCIEKARARVIEARQAALGSGSSE
jgi:hypothetical protein